MGLLETLAYQLTIQLLDGNNPIQDRHYLSRLLFADKSPEGQRCYCDVNYEGHNARRR